MGTVVYGWRRILRVSGLFVGLQRWTYKLLTLWLNYELAMHRFSKQNSQPLPSYSRVRKVLLVFSLVDLNHGPDFNSRYYISLDISKTQAIFV